MPSAADAGADAVQQHQQPAGLLLLQQQQEPGILPPRGGSRRLAGGSGSKQRPPPNGGLGGAYAPGVLWHVKRAKHRSPSGGAGRWPSASVPQPAVQLAMQPEQQQQQGVEGEVLGVDFTLLDRLESHAAASTSGRHHGSWDGSGGSGTSRHGAVNGSSHRGAAASAAAAATASAAVGSSNGSSAASGHQEPQQQQQQQQALLVGAAGEASALQLLALRRSPAANFRDARFEQALSRWMKEAPDWFKVRQVYERYPQRFNIVHVSCALDRLADLTAASLATRPLLRTERAALRAFVAQLLAAAGGLLHSVDGGTAACLLHSLGRLAATGQLPAARDRELLSALLSHAEPCLPTLTPAELGQTMWALKQLQYTPPQAWLDSMYAATEPLLPQLSSLEAALLLRSLGALGVSKPPAPWLSALLAHVEGLLADMEPKPLSMTFTGLGGLQAQPSRAWMAAALAATRARLDRLGPQALSNLLWALCRLGVVPDRAWLADYFRASMQLLASFNRQELSVIIWSLSRLRLEPSDQWLDEYFDATEAQLLRFRLRDLTLLGYSLAKLGLRPPQTWLRRYCTLLLRLKGQLWHNKTLLTQALVALSSFRVPRMDVWRRELYAAAGYKLYRYPNWRQRVLAQPVPQGPYSVWPYNRRRQGRRGGGGSGSRVGAVGAVGGVAGSRLPPVLRSGDWGVMDAMGGAGGVLGGSMSSYEELGPAAAGAAAAPLQAGSSSSSSAGGAAGGGGGGSGAATEAAKKPRRMPGLVRPARPAAAGRADTSGGSSGGSMAEASADQTGEAL